MSSDRRRDQARERPPGASASQPAGRLALSARQPQTEALQAVLGWAQRRGFPRETLAAFRSVVVEFARDPSAPDLELVMRSARAHAVREARRARRCGDAGR